MGVVGGQVTTTANPYHAHIDISWAPLNIYDFSKFMDPEKFDWNYDMIGNMDAQQKAAYEKQIADQDVMIRALNTEIGTVTAARDKNASDLKDKTAESQTNYNNWQGEIDGRHKAETQLAQCQGQLTNCQQGALQNATLRDKVKMLFGF